MYINKAGDGSKDLPSEVVAHEIRVLSEIDSLQRQPAKPLATVDGFILGGCGATTTGLRTPLSVHYYFAKIGVSGGDARYIDRIFGGRVMGPAQIGPIGRNYIRMRLRSKKRKRSLN